MDERLTSVAYHHAGHAIAAIKLGLPATEISIDGETQGGTHGPLSLPVPHGQFRPEVRFTPRVERLMQKSTLVALAGPEAERRYTGRYNNVGARYDRQVASDLSMRLNGSSETERLYFDWKRACARDLVNDPLNWSLIEALVQELLTRRRVSGRRLRPLLSATALRLHN